MIILRHVIDIDKTLKLTQGQGHILQQSTFGSMKCICDKEARLTYLRGVNVLVLSCADFGLMNRYNLAKIRFQTNLDSKHLFVVTLTLVVFKPLYARGGYTPVLLT